MKQSAPSPPSLRPRDGTPTHPPSSRLASGIAHRLNNLLTVVEGHASLLLEIMPQEDPSRPAILAISQAVDAVAELTDELLGFAGKRRLDPRPCGVDELLVEVHRRLRTLADPGFHVHVAWDAGLPPVAVDPDRFLDIVESLALCGRGALEGPGRLDITAHADSRPEDLITFRIAARGQERGPLDTARLFEPFAVVGPVGGAGGMGLAAARGTVVQSGGGLDAESSREGLTFVLRLPAAG